MLLDIPSSASWGTACHEQGLRKSPSPVFSNTILNIRKFTVHVLLKPGLENFEHYFTSV